MRRIISTTLSATLLALLLAAAPTSAAARPACTKGDVQSLVGGTIAIGKQSDRGGENGSAGAWSCQFRLYDGNDGDEEDNPEVPHVFSQDDWFLAGIFDWIPRADMETLGLDRAGACALINAFVDHLYWREQGGDWVELPLTDTSCRSVRAPWGELLAVLRHRYHIFPGGTFAPGIYEWRWEASDSPFDPPDFTVYGQVEIVDN